MSPYRYLSVTKDWSRDRPPEVPDVVRGTTLSSGRRSTTVETTTVESAVVVERRRKSENGTPDHVERPSLKSQTPRVSI